MSAQPEESPGARLTELLERVIAADEAARGWLHETFAPRLRRRLHARYARHEGLDAEDIFQDAFVFFYQHAERTFGRFLADVPVHERTEARLDGYLWDLACGIASNRMRSARRSPALSPEPVERTMDPIDSEGRTLDRDLLTRLRSCLKRSGSRAYLYYQLRFVDGFTPHEIVTVTGWSRKITYNLRLTLAAGIDRCARRLGLR